MRPACRLRRATQAPREPAASVERALCVLAHPDDVDFGSAGTVATWTAAGTQITYCIVTDVRFLAHADGRLELSLDLRRDISRVIRPVRPQRVLTTSPGRLPFAFPEPMCRPLLRRARPVVPARTLRAHSARPGWQAAPMTDERWEQLVADAEGGDVSRGSMFGSQGLRTGKKFFAIWWHDRLVVKLPPARLTEIVSAGQATPFEPMEGRPMNGWVVAGNPSQWSALAQEARAFVAEQNA